MTALAAFVAAAALVVLVGCGGSEAPLPSLRPVTPAWGSPDAEAGEIVLRFVQAATRRHSAQLWALLSEPTRASMGPTLTRFSPGTAQEIADDFRHFRRARIVLARELDEGWAVGAVVGLYEDPDADEPQPAAFAAALRREPEGWRVELGGVLFGRLRPGPLDRVEERPEVRAQAQAGAEIERMRVWIDGLPVAGPSPRWRPFSAEIRGRLERPLPRGDHAVIVFAEAGDTAGALGWPFEVKD